MVERGAGDAAEALGVQFEDDFAPSGDRAEPIEAAAAANPDGLVVSLPDPAALGNAIRSAAAAGVPLVTIDSGLEQSRAVGAMLRVGRGERSAGEAAGSPPLRIGRRSALSWSWLW